MVSRGSPHWIVARDVRGRTELSVGPGTLMGAGETQLMHTLTTAAKKGWAYMEDDEEDSSVRGKTRMGERESRNFKVS